MKALTAPFLLVLLMLFSGLSRAQETDNSVITITKRKGGLLMGEAVLSIQKLDYNKSIEYLTTARTLATEVGNKARIGLTSSNLARLYFQLQDYDKATEENNKAIAIQNTDETKIGLGQSHIIEAQLFLQKKDYAKADTSLVKAFKLFSDERSRVLIANTQYFQAISANAQNKFAVADSLLSKAIPMLKKITNSIFLASSYVQKAKALIHLERTAEAKINIDEANTLVKEHNYKGLEVEILKLDSDLAVLEKNYEQGYDKLEKYTEAQESAAARVKSFELKQPTPGTNAAMANTLSKDIEREQKRKLQVSQLTTVLGFALITILSLLTLSLYKNNNPKGQGKQLLQAKNTELIIAKENAEKASMVKAQFLSTITHELRTPMYAVTGLTHLLLTENPTPEQKKHLDSLKFSGEYLLSLINNILDLNKLEANKVEVEETSFDLKKRIEDVLFALGKSAKDKGNKLSFEFDDDIPNEILGDPLMISQILINLVGNAVKFTRDGDVFVRVQKISQSDTDIRLHFEVEDTGEGISKKKQKSIFQNFTQGSVAINRKFGGTGLGLSIVKNLLDLLKSKITLESTLGKGSTFMFDLKYNLDTAASGEENPHNIIYDVDYVALENRKILVVEDNKINQMITRKILEKNQMVCDVADNGEIAVEMARNDKSFDLILMDIHMPGISGIEATEQIREFDKDIPILALTAVTIDENIDDFHEAGFNDIIPKPYKVEEFFQKIHNALKRSQVIS